MTFLDIIIIIFCSYSFPIPNYSFPILHNPLSGLSCPWAPASTWTLRVPWFWQWAHSQAGTFHSMLQVMGWVSSPIAILPKFTMESKACEGCGSVSRAGLWVPAPALHSLPLGWGFCFPSSGREPQGWSPMFTSWCIACLFLCISVISSLPLWISKALPYFSLWNKLSLSHSDCSLLDQAEAASGSPSYPEVWNPSI